MTELQPTTNFAPIQPPAPKPSSPLLMIILIVFVLFSLAGSCFLYWQNQQMAQQLIQLSSQISSKQITQTITAIPTIVPTIAIDPTVGWKTYTETRSLKFTVKYPSTGTINTKDGMNGEKQATFYSGALAIGSVTVGWNTQSLGKCNGKEVSVQISGQTITMCHNQNIQEPESYYYESTQNGLFYDISTANYPGDDKRQIILQILSTLKLGN
jgi:hypothetical protein